MTQHDKHVGFKANSNTVEEAKSRLDHGELSEELRRTVDRLAHGADVAEETRLTDRLESLREDRRDLKRDREDINDAIEEVDRKIERVERRLDELREQDGEYDGVLSMLEEDLQSGQRILGGSDKIKRAASIGDCSVEAVVDDLRERNPDAPDMAFRPARGDEEPNWKDEQGGDEITLDSVASDGGA